MKITDNIDLLMRCVYCDWEGKESRCCSCECNDEETPLCPKCNREIHYTSEEIIVKQIASLIRTELCKSKKLNWAQLSAQKIYDRFDIKLKEDEKEI